MNTPHVAQPASDRFSAILDTCEPFLVSWTGNWPHLNLKPLGFGIQRTVTATSLASRTLIDGLHRLDAATFGDQDMLMPRWVLFDCGEFPGIVFGFGKRAAELPDKAQRHYQVESPDDFVPLSMWVAIPCAEPRSWFGHNLSSANVLLDEDRLPGLGTLTKLFGVAVTNAQKQYGATQWQSKSLGIHLRMGALELLSAYTPAHTHPETFSYRLHVTEDHLQRVLSGDSPTDHGGVTEWLHNADSKGIRALHDRIEAGESVRLVALDKEGGRIGLAVDTGV